MKLSKSWSRTIGTYIHNLTTTIAIKLTGPRNVRNNHHAGGFKNSASDSQIRMPKQINVWKQQNQDPNLASVFQSPLEINKSSSFYSLPRNKFWYLIAFIDCEKIWMTTCSLWFSISKPKTPEQWRALWDSGRLSMSRTLHATTLEAANVVFAVRLRSVHGDLPVDVRFTSTRNCHRLSYLALCCWRSWVTVSYSARLGWWTREQGVKLVAQSKLEISTSWRDYVMHCNRSD